MMMMMALMIVVVVMLLMTITLMVMMTRVKAPLFYIYKLPIDRPWRLLLVYNIYIYIYTIYI